MWRTPPTSLVPAEYSRSVPTAATALTLNSVIRIGAISEPAPSPVDPMRKPTASPASTSSRFIGIRSAHPPSAAFLQNAANWWKKQGAPCPAPPLRVPLRHRQAAGGGSAGGAAVGVDQHLSHLGTGELGRRHLAAAQHLAHLGARQVNVIV